MLCTRNKRGDTLIEVILAVGIFSMVAVAVLAVMNGGASSAQLSLEATLAREEVDTQAEALRFIHSSYIAEKISGETEGLYTRLWQRITGQIGGSDSVKVVRSAWLTDEILNFNPGECSSLYDEHNGEAGKYGFVINTRKLGTTDDDVLMTSSSRSRSGSPILRDASTYPRLVYQNNSNEEEKKLASESGYDNLSSAEGIYIIAVEDPDSSYVSGRWTTAYYDFYIRTCWYGSGESAASTIYTLVRLSDPSQ